MTEPTYLEPLNKEAALKLSEDIDALLGQISAHELRLAKSYARLGGYLREVKNQQYWIAYGYDRFSSYLEYVRTKIGRERSQVYSYLSVAEALLPLMSETELETVGISKAHELRRLVLERGTLNLYVNVDLDFEPYVGLDQRPPDAVQTTISIVDFASRPDVTAKQLHAKINEILHVHEPSKGTWFDVGGFYATADERKEIDQFWNIGKKLFGPPDEQSDHVWKHEVFLAAVRECLGTWSAEVNQ